MNKIVFVCLGKLCRSPMAEFVMKNLTTDVKIESRTTSLWEHGNPIHRGTQGILKQYQIPYEPTKSSQQLTRADAEKFDLIIGMNRNNIRDLKKMVPAHLHYKIHPFAVESIPDPYYTRDFEETYQRILAGCKEWLQKLKQMDSM